MQTKHTPGPWSMEKRVRSNFHQSGYRIWNPELTEIIAAAENNEANARLIAAAPDLLAALEQIADENFANLDSPQSMRMRLRDFRERARAAIARVKADK